MRVMLCIRDVPLLAYVSWRSYLCLGCDVLFRLVSQSNTSSITKHQHYWACALQRSSRQSLNFSTTAGKSAHFKGMWKRQTKISCGYHIGRSPAASRKRSKPTRVLNQRLRHLQLLRLTRNALFTNPKEQSFSKSNVYRCYASCDSITAFLITI